MYQSAFLNRMTHLQLMDQSQFFNKVRDPSSLSLQDSERSLPSQSALSVAQHLQFKMASSQGAMDIATQAAALSTKLHATDESVRKSATEIESIANEIGVLSAVLWRLHEAMAIDPDRYTEAFQQDLREILQELKLLFDEISDVAVELEKQDGLHTGIVKRFLKKGKVQYLLKHLTTLKTTLAVMKTVLQHGCEFDPERLAATLKWLRQGRADRMITYRFPKLPTTADPHTLQEEHAILESVFLNHRNAIEELHELDDEYQKAKASGEFHHRRGSSGLSDIPEFPPMPDMVSPSKSGKKPPKSCPNNFSRRGMRLAVHMSILDMGAHKAPNALKDKWVQTSRAHAHQRTMSGARSNHSPNSTSTPPFNDKSPGPLKATNRHKPHSSSISDSGSKQEDDHHYHQLETEANKENRARRGSLGLISHAAAEKLHHVIDRLEVAKKDEGEESSGEGEGKGMIGKLVPSLSLHKRRKSTTKMDVLNSFSG